jgi:hypothetical protein
MRRTYLAGRCAVRARSCAVLLSLAVATVATAVPPVTLGPSGSPTDQATVGLGVNAEDDTGVRIRNKGLQTGVISIERLPGPSAGSPTVGSPYPGAPFKMIDQTLVRITSAGIPADDLRVQVRIEYGRRMLRRLGLRERTVHVMKFDPRRQVWFPAVFANGAGVPLQFLPGESADFVEGHFGIDFGRRHAWVVNSTQSDYALAAAVPEPVSAGLVLLGGLALLGRRRGSADQQA